MANLGVEKNNLMGAIVMNDLVFTRSAMMDDVQLIKVLGRGSSGEASLVSYKGEVVCMKTSSETSMLKEAEAKCCVNGAGGTPKLLAFSDDGSVLLMEYIQGVTLLKFGENASPEDLSSVVSKVKQQLQQLHQAGFAYNDLHSENVLVSGPPGELTVRLFDLGYAKPLVSDDEAYDWFRADNMVF